jgi:uncharacterized DUF497 family protein
VSTLHFEWDDRKATVNAKKHGVSFEEARSVFVDEHAKLIDDPDHSLDEDRWSPGPEQHAATAAGVPLLQE